MTNEISKSYENLLADKKSGKLTDEEAIARSYSLRDKPNTPEEINIDNLDNALDFILNENHLEDFYREKVRKEQLLETTQKEKEELQLALQSYRDKEKLESERIEKNEFDQRKSLYINETWLMHRKSNNKDLFLLLTIAILTFALIAIPFFIGLSKELKDWFLEFHIWQIVIIIIYLILATIDILGSRYLYKKDKISNGWNWLKTIFNYAEYKETKIENLRNEYNE